jgi:hypothetical protein
MLEAMYANKRQQLESQEKNDVIKDGQQSGDSGRSGSGKASTERRKGARTPVSLERQRHKNTTRVSKGKGNNVTKYVIYKTWW